MLNTVLLELFFMLAFTMAMRDMNENLLEILSKSGCLKYLL